MINKTNNKEKGVIAVNISERGFLRNHNIPVVYAIINI
jgi:hypothetical protein